MIKDLTTILDLSAADVSQLLHSAFRFKELHERGVRREPSLDGRVVSMIFEKPSLRTKVAFEVAATYLGATPVFLTSEQILASGQQERGRESVVDIARNLERMSDLLVARVYSHTTIRTLAETVRIPVVNALCDQHHPTQALADLMTMQWHKGRLCGLTVSYVGDGNNVATSLLQACAMMGVHFRIASPPGYEIPRAEVQRAQQLAAESKSELSFVSDPRQAVKDADVVYTDTFVSMGQEKEKEQRLASFKGYQVTSTLLGQAKKDVIFMHCLPAHRGEEVTDEVMDGPHSVVFDQAECRLHIAKAILSGLLREYHHECARPKG
ncbi:MAG: ornithine carbamoyltransferase [Bdellovibrionota bacterium]|nr:MAG: ornithine carbamoyltransferase [Bdellovibrionota bacterium]